MYKKIAALLITSLVCTVSTAVFSSDDHSHHEHKHKSDADLLCPVASPYKDEFGNTVSYEEKFGAGTEALMNCLQVREDVKLVMQVNQFKDGRGRPYGFRAFPMMLPNFKITHGIPAEELDIVVVVHGGGYPFVLDPEAATPHAEAGKNDVKPLVQWAMDNGVTVYFCLETAAAKNIKTNQLIPGVKLVPGGLIAITDHQARGYSYIQP